MDGLKTLFEAYKADAEKLPELISGIEAELEKYTTTMNALNEPVASSRFDVTEERNRSKQLLTQIEVKLQQMLTQAKTDPENMVYDNDLENLFNEYQSLRFSSMIDFTDDFTTPPFLDVNLWIRKGKVMTPLNDMIWRPTKRYDEGDIVMCFMDGIFFADIDYNGTNTYWSFKSKGFDKLQGKDLRPVYFICKKGCINEHPFNNEMGKCLVKNSINYYAVEITSIITIGNAMAFSTRWFNNKEYWEPITNQEVLMTIWRDYNTPCGNLMSSTNYVIDSLWSASIGWSTNVDENGNNVLYCDSYALGCYKIAHSWTSGSMGYKKFPNFKTTKETTFEAAYAKWTK